MKNVYQELSEVSRRQILAELRGGARTVGELVTVTGLKQPNLSNHLARMRSRGVVVASKVGRQVYYTLADGEVEGVVRAAFAESAPCGGGCDPCSLAIKYAKAAVHGEEPCCAGMIETAVQNQLSLVDICEKILAPAMTLVGDWYLSGCIDEAQEHMASSVTERIVARAFQSKSPAPQHGRLAILGCAPGNWHVIGLRMVSDYLRLLGWKTLFLGANVPIAAFCTTVANHQPQLILTSVSAHENLDDSVALVGALASCRKGPCLIAVGGREVETHEQVFRDAGADIICPTLRCFAEAVLPDLRESAASA